MADSDAKSVDAQPDLDSLDETMPMQTLEHLLLSSEPDPSDPEPVTRAPARDNTETLLRRLVEVSESMDGRLEQIAALLKDQGTRKRATATRRKIAKKRTPQSAAKS